MKLSYSTEKIKLFNLSYICATVFKKLLFLAAAVFRNHHRFFFMLQMLENGSRFLAYDSGPGAARCLIFMSDVQRRVVNHPNTVHLFMDGTFDVAAPLFSQVCVFFDRETLQKVLMIKST